MQDSKLENTRSGPRRISAGEKGRARNARLSLSIEKKIERLLSQSEARGWSYGDFAISFFEVLIVLQLRNRMKNVPAPKRAASTELSS
jgi:hypothetical protein